MCLCELILRNLFYSLLWLFDSLGILFSCRLSILILLGDRGRYFIGLTDIDPVLKKMFCDLLDVASGLIKKYTKRSELKR